ncbi:MAG: methyltransferase domain-containing protein [bacterium]|nr:methyltransferase domain-containing protein [bacterium]
MMTPPAHRADLARHFDDLAPAWNDCPFLDQPGEGEHVLRLLRPEPGDTGLDLACGTGQLTARLSPAGGRIMAADLSDRMLKLAACRFVEQRLNNIVITVQDAHRLEFADGLFDWVACRWAFRTFEDPAVVLRELARVTRPGSRLYLSDWAEPAALLDACLNRLDPFHQHVTGEAWWDTALAGLPFAVESRRRRAERLDPVVWGALAGLSGEEALARFDGFRAAEGRAARYLDLDGRPVLIAERLELLMTRIPAKPRGGAARSGATRP